MPLWKIHHPAGAYSSEDRRGFSTAITSLYEAIPIPKFYVVVLFEEIAADTCFVGGRSHDKFVRICIDQMARTLPGAVIREWWVHHLDEAIRPWVAARGYEWEFTINEAPADLWSIQGHVPPPFESHGEKRWVADNTPSSYALQEKLPVKLSLTPGVTGVVQS